MYDPTSWWSWPLWWNAVIQDICEAKGSWTFPTFSPYALCVCVCVWLLAGVERCQRVGFSSPIVHFHCVGVCVRGEQAPPMTFSQKEALFFQSRELMFGQHSTISKLTVGERCLDNVRPLCNRVKQHCTYICCIWYSSHKGTMWDRHILAELAKVYYTTVGEDSAAAKFGNQCCWIFCR